MKAREVKRAKLAKRYAHKREEIAAAVKSGEMDHEEAWIALSKLPRNSNPIRQHNRCKITGRPEGLHPTVRHQPYPVPRDGFEGSDPGRYEGQLVIFGDSRVRPCPGTSVWNRGSSPVRRSPSGSARIRFSAVSSRGGRPSFPHVRSKTGRLRRKRVRYGCRIRVDTSQYRGKCRRGGGNFPICGT